MKTNTGYRLGMYIRRVLCWFSRHELEYQQRGIPRWIARFPRYLVIVIITGLLLVGAFYLALFLAMLVGIAFCLAKTKNESLADLSDESLGGYYYSGPEGPGFYYNGKRIDD